MPTFPQKIFISKDENEIKRIIDDKKLEEIEDRKIRNAYLFALVFSAIATICFASFIFIGLFK